VLREWTVSDMSCHRFEINRDKLAANHGKQHSG
jgi:hypothetical protein